MKHHICDPEHEAGKPLCDLAYSGCQTVHLKGASGTICAKKVRSDPSKWYDVDCQIMIIGEAPGFDEDKCGIPFVGNSGDLLIKKFLKSAGFNLDQVYITNTVKCKPPIKRSPNKPSLEEIQACKRHLEWEMRTLEPEVVILLGTSALRAFNLHSEGKMKYIHGKLFERKFPGWDDGPTFKVIPTYHPAFFLHKDSPRLENRVVRDYIFAKNLVDRKDMEYKFHVPKYETILSLERAKEFSEFLNTLDEFAFDTESVALPWYKQPLIMFSFSWGEGKNAVLPLSLHDPDASDIKLRPAWVDRNKVLDLLRVPFENENIAKIAHNIKYDSQVIRKWCGFEVKGMWWDTMLMHHLLEEQGPHDLEFLADLEFGVGDYSAPKREITGHGNVLRNTYDKVPDEILHPYAATDAECVWRLKQVYLERIIKKPNLHKLYMEETLPIQYTLAEAEWYGNKIDPDSINGLIEEYKKKQEGIVQEIVKVTQDPNFNPSSPKQVIAMMKKLGYEEHIINERKTTGYSVDKESLEKLAGLGCDLARLILDYRKIVKLNSTYLYKALNEVDDDGRLRYSWLIHGTESGRLSCRLLHQVPRSDEKRTESGKKNLRDIFIAEDGYVYFYGDYSQIELRILSLLADDKEMKKAFANKEDVHKTSAAAALDISYDKVSYANRQIGKDINFGTSFGSQGYRLSQGNYYEDPADGKRKKVTLKMVQKFIERFDKKFTGIAKYKKDTPDEAIRNNGLIVSVFGRERHLSGLNDTDQKKRDHAKREALNVKIQGPAGAITIRTANEIRKMLREKGIGPEIIRLVNTVHDSLAYEVKKEYIDWFSMAFPIVAERPIPELENYSFPVDCGIGKSWGDAEANSK